MKVGIIGTAGRSKLPEHKMTRLLYLAMFHKAKEILLSFQVLFEEIELVSGGAAWVDHLAVSLFKEQSPSAFAGLTLHLPAPFHNSKFLGGFKSSGAICNWYHNQFGVAVGVGKWGTLRGLQGALDMGAEFTVEDGFFVRNSKVGQVDALMAFTWGPGRIPVDGGTLHTWRNSNAPMKIHVPLASLLPS